MQQQQVEVIIGNMNEFAPEYYDKLNMKNQIMKDIHSALRGGNCSSMATVLALLVNPTFYTSPDCIELRALCGRVGFAAFGILLDDPSITADALQMRELKWKRRMMILFEVVEYGAMQVLKWAIKENQFGDLMSEEPWMMLCASASQQGQLEYLVRLREDAGSPWDERTLSWPLLTFQSLNDKRGQYAQSLLARIRWATRSKREVFFSFCTLRERPDGNDDGDDVKT